MRALIRRVVVIGLLLFGAHALLSLALITSLLTADVDPEWVRDGQVLFWSTHPITSHVRSYAPLNEMELYLTSFVDSFVWGFAAAAPLAALSLYIPMRFQAKAR